MRPTTTTARPAPDSSSGGPPSWIPPAFAKHVDLDARRRLRQGAATEADACVVEAFQSGWTVLMVEMSERAAARAGIEERHPFFDRRIAEFALAIPETQRWKGAQTKHVIRTAMRERLPPSVYDRATKADFSKYVVAAIDALGGETFFERLEIAHERWVDGPRAVAMSRDMFRRCAAGDDRFTEHMFPLWMIASVELWFRARRTTPAPPPFELALPVRS